MSAELSQKTRHAEFVSSVSHELKTPLASIKAFLELITDGDVEDREEQQQLYGLMDLQIDRLTRLINNMLNLARIESGVVQIRREDCELNEILVKVLEVITPVAMEKRITVKPELSELYLSVSLDRDLFSQAIINLMSNAVKYTPEGGEVRLRSRLQDGEVTIEVRDTGLGIPEESLPRIFERFYRVPQNNQAAPGTGLGLAFVQHIVSDVHGGRIGVTSKVGEGSCFTVAIPVGQLKSIQKKHGQDRTQDDSELLVGTAADA
jgi:two-component system phosphate regulon sensor histidine kinase PhoR